VARKKSILDPVAVSMIAMGAIVAGFSVWQMVAQESLSANTQQQAAEVEPLITSAEAAVSGDLKVGEVFAKLYVPRFGKDYVRQIAEGTSVSKVLNTVGIGHYLGTAMPGEVGNFAIAGHRAGNGGPMRHIDKFTNGDLVYVETATTWFTYKYLEQQVVDPTALEVIDPVPVGLTASTSSNKFLTMTTCTPIYVNTQRIAAWFELVDEQPVSSGRPF
jgi:sortase A